LIPVDQIPSPGSVKVIRGEGISAFADEAVGDQESQISKGDLYIMFDIEFPKRLPACQQKRSELIAALTPASQ